MTDEMAPSPDAGRVRRDGGYEHAVLDIWHATTLASIGRDTIDAGQKGGLSMAEEVEAAVEFAQQLTERSADLEDFQRA